MGVNKSYIQWMCQIHFVLFVTIKSLSHENAQKLGWQLNVIINE